MIICLIALLYSAFSSPIFGTPREVAQGNKIIHIINKERMQSQTAQHQLPKVSYFYEFLWDINNFKDQVGPEHFKNVSTTLLFDPLFESGNFYVRYGMHYLLTGKTPVVKNIKPKQYLDPNLELVAAFTVDENYYMYGRVLSPGL